MTAVSTTAEGGRVHRVTMFKVPDAENQKRLVEEYEVLGREQRKDGKPYILSLRVGRTIQAIASSSSSPSPSSAPGGSGEGAEQDAFTVIAEADFASLADMEYYDNGGCAAHAALRQKARGGGWIAGGPKGVMTVVFRAGVEVGF